MKDKEEYFKLELEIIIPIHRTITRKFSTLKIMRQWMKRKDLDNAFWCLGYKDYILNTSGEWERFAIFGTTLITLGDLEKAIDQLKKE